MNQARLTLKSSCYDFKTHGVFGPRVFNAMKVVKMQSSNATRGALPLQLCFSALRPTTLLCLTLLCGCEPSESLPKQAPPAEKVIKRPPPRIKDYYEYSYQGHITLDKPLRPRGKEPKEKGPPDKLQTEKGQEKLSGPNEIKTLRPSPVELKLQFEGDAFQLIRGGFKAEGCQYSLNGTREGSLLRIQILPDNKGQSLDMGLQTFRGVGLLSYKKPESKALKIGTIEGSIQLGRGDAKIFTSATISMNAQTD